MKRVNEMVLFVATSNIISAKIESNAQLNGNETMTHKSMHKGMKYHAKGVEYIVSFFVM